MSKKVSFYIPCYNEVGNVRETAEILTSIMQSLSYDYELVFTDNCSTDGTKDILRELAGNDKHIKVLMNCRNYGVDGRSARNALKYLTGDVAVMIPCDLQEPPELVPKFLLYWEQGYKVVCGQKIASQEGKIKFACRSLFYKIIKWMSDIPQYEHLSGISLLDREVLDELLRTDHELALRFVIADMGCDVKLIQYEQRARKSGKSSYNIWKSLDFAIRSLILTSIKPLRLMTVAGTVMSILSFIMGLVYVIFKLIFWQSISTEILPILIGMLFLGSIQLLCLGMVGEYIGAISKRMIRYPEVMVAEKLNFEDVK